MATTTTDTSLRFTVAEDIMLEEEFGGDAEYYEQHEVTWVVQMTDEEGTDYGMPECFPIMRGPDGKLNPSETPEFDFDWESAEEFRGGPFPS